MFTWNTNDETRLLNSSTILLYKTTKDVFYAKEGAFGNDHITISLEITKGEGAIGRYFFIRKDWFLPKNGHFCNLKD